MSSPPVLQGATWLRPMAADDLDAVMAIEQQAYAFPWSRGNFLDSLRSGHPITLLFALEDERLLGYSVGMVGFEEMHLLNLTVHPAVQGRGHGRALLDALCVLGRGLGCAKLWLEVRPTNAGAQRLYRRYGFVELGRRKGYYPAGRGEREDAIVMALALDPTGAAHAG